MMSHPGDTRPSPRLYRAYYTAKADGHERRMTYWARSDAAAVEFSRTWALQDKLNYVESLRTKQRLILEV